VVEENFWDKAGHHNGDSGFILRPLFSSINHRTISGKFKTNDAHDDESEANKSHGCSWLAEKGNAAKNGSNRADARPNGVSGADG